MSVRQKNCDHRVGAETPPRQLAEDRRSCPVIAGVDERHPSLSERDDRDARKPVDHDSRATYLTAIGGAGASQERKRQDPDDRNHQNRQNNLKHSTLFF